MKSHVSPSQHSVINFNPSSNDKMSIPRLHARDLNGNNWGIPHDLPANKTLLLFVFKREQQSLIDSWIDGLGLRASENKIAWIEIPLLQKPWKILSSWIDQRMKRGITNHDLRGHVWTIYTNRGSFLKNIGLNSSDSICVLVVRKDGSVLSSASGEYSKSSAELILKELQN
ncbi:MAG: hypothetical protein K2W97_08510 [Chthoniobacterales bacterium]|nr:hypothetical protein [Chthoniobacterales bacterium]